jgi:hypothetical protein
VGGVNNFMGISFNQLPFDIGDNSLVTAFSERCIYYVHLFILLLMMFIYPEANYQWKYI